MMMLRTQNDDNDVKPKMILLHEYLKDIEERWLLIRMKFRQIKFIRIEELPAKGGVL